MPLDGQRATLMRAYLPTGGRVAHPLAPDDDQGVVAFLSFCPGCGLCGCADVPCPSARNSVRQNAAMNFLHAEDARNEALSHPVGGPRARWLADACRHRPERLRRGGVRGHAVSYHLSAWPELPTKVGDGRWITRGDV